VFAEPKAALSVKTPVFEGPLELLLELVERRKLLINDVSLAAVTDEYIARVGDMQEHSLPNTAHFVALAATLLLIKSKSLLPILELSSEEEAIVDDLELRLKIYQFFRDRARKLFFTAPRRPLFEPEYSPPRSPLFHPDRLVTLSSLRSAMASVVSALPREEGRPKVSLRPTISLEAMIERIRREMGEKIKTRFFALTAGESERKNVIVGFLAVLELFKQGGVLVVQVGRFSDIELELAAADTPRYL
jgi:segregation and condensation protein A